MEDGGFFRGGLLFLYYFMYLNQTKKVLFPKCGGRGAKREKKENQIWVCLLGCCVVFSV